MCSDHLAVPVVVEVRIILQPILSRTTNLPVLFYSERFQVVNNADGEAQPVRGSDMYHLQRHYRQNKACMGDIM